MAAFGIVLLARQNPRGRKDCLAAPEFLAQSGQAGQRGSREYAAGGTRLAGPNVPPMHEILEHAADVGFRVQARSLPELFEGAAEALVSIALETASIDQRNAYPIEAEGESKESLLVNWLSEILYYLDGRQLAFGAFEVTELTANRVRGDGLGEPRDPSRHPARLIVKGVTWHQLKIEHRERGWTCEVFVDI